MLTKRQKKILQMLLRNSGTLTNREIASKLEVSQRTIRNDISQINLEALKSGVQVHSGGNGYFLLAADRSVFIEILRGGDSYSSIYESSEMRQLYIIFQLLWIDIPVTINELADTMFCSRTTVSKDIAEMKEIVCGTDGIRLESGREGILLIGSEESRRNFIGKIFLEIYEKGDIQNVRSMLAKLGIVRDEDFLWLYDFFISFFGKLNLTLSDRGMYLFTLENLVLYNRILMGFLVEEQDEETELLNLPYELLEEHFHLSINQNERAYFSSQVASRCQIMPARSRPLFAEEIIHDYIEELAEIFRIDRTVLRQYQDGLISHLSSMIERLDQKIMLDSSVINEIKMLYPYAFECSTVIIPLIQKYMNRTLGETEISYIAVHLAVILDHLKRPVNVVIFCASGISTSLLVSTKMMRYFGDRISIIGTFPYYQASTVFSEYPEIDMAVTTIPFEEEVPVPVMQISPLLNAYDVKRLDQFLEKAGQYREEEKSEVSLNRELFFVFSGGESRTEMCRQMAEALQNHGYIFDAEEFAESVAERESLYSTLYGNIWLPHPLRSFAVRNGVCSAIIRKNDETIIVFMMCIRKEDTALFNGFYDRILDFLDNKELNQRLGESTCFEEFSTIFSGAEDS